MAVRNSSTHLGRRGVSGVVAAVFMLLIAALFAAYTISAIRNLRTSIEELNSAETEALNDRAAVKALNATYRLERNAVVIAVYNNNPFAVLITAITVVYDYGVKLYARTGLPPLAVYLCLNGTCAPRTPSLPTSVPAGGEAYIAVPREKGSVRAVALSTVPSTNPVVLPALPARQRG